MSDRKLIIPAEVKLCATCSFWDGDRKVDDEMRVVIVSEKCCGVCLYKECSTEALTDVRHVHHCMWEDIDGEAAPAAEQSQDQAAS